MSERPWGWGCPHCGDEDEIVEVVEAIREYAVRFDTRGVSGMENDLGEQVSRVLGYRCEACGREFEKPKRWYGELHIRWATERGHWECPDPGCSRAATERRMCDGSGPRPHPPIEMIVRPPVRKSRRYILWEDFLQDLRSSGVPFADLNLCEVNGRPMFTHENPASSVDLPDSAPG